MIRTIDIGTNGRENISLFDTHDITILRGDNNDVELVIHPSPTGSLRVRHAKDPYCCKIKVRNRKGARWIDINLSSEEDWGNIDTTNPLKPRYGNEEAGYSTIERIELMDGYPAGTEIPFEQFSRDVDDFIIYHEC